MTTMERFCTKCDCVEVHAECPTIVRGRLGTLRAHGTVLSCGTCGGFVFRCNLCQKCFTCRSIRKTTRIERHLNFDHGIVPMRSPKQTGSKKTNMISPEILDHRIENIGVVQMQEDVELETGENDLFSLSLGDNTENDNELVSSLLSSFGSCHKNSDDDDSSLDTSDDFPNLIMDEFNFFTLEKSKMYFWTEYSATEDVTGEHAGVRGIAWRAIHRRKLYGPRYTLTLADTKLLLKMTIHLMNNSKSQRSTFFNIISDIQSRMVGYVGGDLSIPRTVREDESVLLSGSYSIFRNVPHEAVRIISGHACISLKGLIKYVCALGIEIGFTESSSESRKWDGVHGTESVTKLVTEMKNNVNLDRPYAALCIWPVL